MTTDKIIAVAGATGQQGGAAARAILADPAGGFTVRALTRDPGKIPAGTFPDVVAADLEDERSMVRAFDGVYGAFVVTDHWAPLRPGDSRSRARREIDQVAVAARAAHTAGLKHVVWSTLEDTRPHFTHLGINAPADPDGFTVAHFDAKAVANRHFTDLGVPTTFLETTSFYEHFLAPGRGPVRDGNGSLVLRLAYADSTAALVSANDIGQTAYAILKAGPRLIGRTVGLAGDHATGEQIARMFTGLLGEQVTYQPVPLDTLPPEPAAMFRFYTGAAESLLAHRDLDRIRRLHPGLQSLPDWLADHEGTFRQA